jgi:hypothetical protein
MENQEEKETSLEYFYDKVLDASEFYESEYKAIVDALNEAKKIYEEEIISAKKEGWKIGYQDRIKMSNKQINKLYRAIVIIFSVFSALILLKLIYILISHV